MEYCYKSEVARQLEQIRLEYEAAQRGLSGTAQGTSRHAFITARMRRIEQTHRKLQILVGPQEALRLIAETMQTSDAGEGSRKAQHPTTAENDGRSNEPGANDQK